jgi:hypothetical protein
MANSPVPFRPDRRRDERIRPWSDGVVDKLGFHTRSPTVSCHLAGQRFAGDISR